MMKLVEVIRTEHTDPAVFDRAYAWVGDIGKVAVSCGDTPVGSPLCLSTPGLAPATHSIQLFCCFYVHHRASLLTVSWFPV
jgi:3-hydroxyacyl-CoA dehydrogenase